MKTRLTLHTSTAGLQDPRVHVHPRLRHQLISRQVRVMRRGYEVIIQRLCHVLIHLVVFRVEDVSSRTPHVIGKTCAVFHIILIISSTVTTNLCLKYVNKSIKATQKYNHSKLQRTEKCRCEWRLVPSIPRTPRALFSGHGSNLDTISRQCSFVTPLI